MRVVSYSLLKSLVERFVLYFKQSAARVHGIVSPDLRPSNGNSELMRALIYSVYAVVISLFVQLTFI